MVCSIFRDKVPFFFAGKAFDDVRMLGPDRKTDVPALGDSFLTGRIGTEIFARLDTLLSLAYTEFSRHKERFRTGIRPC